MSPTPKQRLPDRVKSAVVCALACFDSPSIVAAVVRKDFDVAVSPQAVEAYDPTKHAGRNLSAKWREMFERTRAAFVTEIGKIAISHRAVRLRALDRMARRAEESGNLSLAVQIIVEAAKECGDVHTNRHRIDANVHQTCDPRELSNAELEAIINESRASGKIPEVIIRGGLPD